MRRRANEENEGEKQECLLVQIRFPDGKLPGFITDTPLTATLMVWCTEPSWFLAVHRYSPASDSDTFTMRRVLLKCRKDVRLDGRSPLSLVQDISGVGLNQRQGVITEMLGSQIFQTFNAGGFSHLQSLSDALHLQNVSSQHHHGA